uniref:Protein TsetseEP domain-containing protein n=1 Tax=Anopheles atroparvus TaxID=41427 RepID=A0A182JB73_ANOAO
MNLKSLVCAVFVCVAVWSTAATAQEVDPASGGLTLADQAAQYKETVLLVLQKRSTSVPPQNAAEVTAVLAEASQQLDACADALVAHQQVWQYKVCGSAVLQQGLAGLNALQAASSAASS